MLAAVVEDMEMVLLFPEQRRFVPEPSAQNGFNAAIPAGETEGDPPLLGLVPQTPDPLVLRRIRVDIPKAADDQSMPLHNGTVMHRQVRNKL
ncbi:MAG: hypothetical protein ED859_07600 [Desulfuromonadales bacterium]|nr:MAG: hypothetical protein ED859_07600 [Desulfuromonadales bacterium]